MSAQWGGVPAAWRRWPLESTDVALRGVGFEVAKRARAAKRIYDLIEFSAYPTEPVLAAMNPVAFDSFATSLDGSEPSKAIMLAWLDGSVSLLAESLSVLCLDKADFRAAPPTAGVEVRELGENDVAAFDAFMAAVPEMDTDLAGIEPWHDFVAGTFDQGLLRAIASARPFRDDDDETPESRYDLRCLTLPAFRGRGYALAAASLLCRLVFEHQGVPQALLRSDAPTGIADRLGFRTLALWQYPSPSKD